MFVRILENFKIEKHAYYKGEIFETARCPNSTNDILFGDVCKGKDCENPYTIPLTRDNHGICVEEKIRSGKIEFARGSTEPLTDF